MTLPLTTPVWKWFVPLLPTFCWPSHWVSLNFKKLRKCNHTVCWEGRRLFGPFIASYQVVHNINLSFTDDSHFDNSIKVVSARLLHYKLFSPCNLYIYYRELLWNYVNISFFIKLLIYSFIYVFISEWTRGFSFIQWVIICCYHYLFWHSNCPRLGQW